LFPSFATGVDDTGSKFTAGVVDTGAIATGVDDTSGTSAKPEAKNIMAFPLTAQENYFSKNAAPFMSDL
jgi:hypothetical protein